MLSGSPTWSIKQREMYSGEAQAAKKKQETERKEREELALKKEDVRRKVKKYDRLKAKGKTKAGGGEKVLKRMIRQSEGQAEQASRTAARMELLLQEEAGFIEGEGLEKTYSYRQRDISAAVPIANKQHYFDLKLDHLGPYSIDYSRNGRHLLIGGCKGHIATMDWRDKRLNCEYHVKETVRDVQFLHNEMMYAVAQKRLLYIYDHTGMELHCMKKHDHVNKLTFLPYHFLLVSADDHGTLRYLDTSIGQPVAEFRTKLGTLKSIAQNPCNAIVQLGHYNGTVTLWSPNVSTPLVKIQCHRGPITSLAVDTTGHYLATAAMDARLKIWDLRTYRPLHTYTTRYPATSLDISQRGLLALGKGRNIEVWQDALVMKQSAPYLTHRVQGEVATVRFCPFEDCLGIGHSRGFSSMIVPGAGEPNFDALEVNPFQSKRQRQETEVKQLLEKIPSDLISLDPDSISKLGQTALRETEDELKKRELEDQLSKSVGKKKKTLQKELGRVQRKQQVHKRKKKEEEESEEEASEEEDEDKVELETSGANVLDRFR